MTHYPGQFTQSARQDADSQYMLANASKSPSGFTGGHHSGALLGKTADPAHILSRVGQKKEPGLQLLKMSIALFNQH